MAVGPSIQLHPAAILAGTAAQIAGEPATTTPELIATGDLGPARR